MQRKIIKGERREEKIEIVWIETEERERKKYKYVRMFILQV